jgi:circadian clock protein KaiB
VRQNYQRSCRASFPAVEVIHGSARHQLAPIWHWAEAIFRSGSRFGILEALLTLGTASRKEGLLSQYILKLYVTGKTSKAEVAIANLKRICEEELCGKYELQIIDVLEQPQMAEDDKILATPTLIKRLPLPLRRVIGDLSDKHKVLLGLEVRQGISPPSPESPSSTHDR